MITYKVAVTDENYCEECDGYGERDDPDSVGCGDPTCCSPAPMWCRRCNGTGIDPEKPR